MSPHRRVSIGSAVPTSALVTCSFDNHPADHSSVRHIAISSGASRTSLFRDAPTSVTAVKKGVARV